jgi:aminomethyltransferase
VATLPYFGLAKATLGGVAVTISRTGYTGDLGFEIWVDPRDALRAWDAVWEAGLGRGVIPIGMTALYMARIEAGLLLLGVDFESSRYAFTDAHRSTPTELGLGWAIRDAPTTDRAFIGRDAIRRELREKTSRWRTAGIVVDWRAWDRVHDEAGLIPPKDHTPVHDEYYLYDDTGQQLGSATSQMYSPMLQRQLGLARVPLAMPAGARLKLEVPVNHRYVYVDAEVGRLPLFNPERRTA